MRVVALISGGKDSCYNAMQCVAAGHTLIALANLKPEGKDELDSFMFQTVGHEAVELLAEAMGLPLYSAVTSGRSEERGMHYTPREGDEVEDLYHLLHRVQSAEGVEGVASGAVLSDYQRLRVENVCSRLGLTSLAYLWRQDQAQLLEDMTCAGLMAVVIKVAAAGLTEAHLGQSLLQMQPYLTQLHRRYGVHMCGEGGEYETLTLDCPLFTHRIIIDESEVVMVTPDKVAPVAYLKLHRLHLEKKCSFIPRSLSPVPADKVTAHIPGTQDIHCGGCDGGETGGDGRVWRWGVFEGTGEDMSQQAHSVFSRLSDWLVECGSRAREIVLCRVLLSSMSNFSLLNSVYSTFFPSNPPARVCVQLSLPASVLVRMEVLLCQSQEIVAMHVQSVSHWAPANIGPYSQTVRVGKMVFTAGQIGLEPATMTPVAPPLQPSLALRHVGRVLEANHAHLTSALCGMCYYTTEEAGWASRMTWTEQLQELGGCRPAVVFLRVPALPRGVCVEWNFIALTSPSQLHYYSSYEVKEGVGVLSSEVVTWCGDGEGAGCDEGTPLAGVWLFVLTPHPARLSAMDDAVRVCVQELAQQLAVSGVAMRDISQLQFFLPHFSSGTKLSSDKLQDLGGAVSVSVTTCEGYYGQNCPVSLLALLLPSSLLTDQ